MKKLLSLTIVAIMLLSALMLTSCDPLTDIQNFINGFTHQEPPDEEPKVEEIRTTITELEWLKTYKLTNFTIRVDSGSNVFLVMASDSAIKLDYYEMWFGNEIIIYDIEASCTVVESSIGWLGFISEDMTYNENFDLEELELIPEFSFTDLTYNEESKSYSITDNGAIYEFKFENGALTHMLMLPESANIDAKIEITNVGATVVEIPNYDIANDGKVAPSTADESVRTTVTNEELAAMFDMTNFTFHCVVAMDGAVADMFIKVDEKGLALKASDGSQTATQYYVLIDGEFYMLQTNSEGKYEPVAEDGTISEMVASIELIKENLYLDTLTYDENGRYYKIVSGTMGMYGYFENGQLVKVVEVIASAEGFLEIVFILEDVGTTNTYVPKYEIYKEELEFKLNSDGTGYIVSDLGKYTESDVVIPETYNGLPVVGIGYNAFFSDTKITSVVIPETVTYIDEFAFFNCTSLKSVTIPNTVKSIGGNAFAGCRSLESITLPEGLTAISEDTFDCCTLLKTVNIPNSVTSIGANAFGHCRALESINIPASVTSIGKEAFLNCSALTSITFEITDGWYCENKTNKINLEASALESTKTAATYLTTDYVDYSWKLPQKLEYELNDDGVSYTVIGAGNYTNSEIVIPDAYEGLPVTAIGEYAFSDKDFITSITIPDSVLVIGNGAFAACDALANVNIGNSVTVIGENAFRFCISLESIALPDSVITIGGAAFYYCTSLKSIVIPGSVTSIEMGTLANCSALEEITIPNSVTVIGDWAFQACTSLKTVVIPDGVTTIGETAFYGCTSLTTVTIPNTITSCGENVFQRCSAITTIYFAGTIDEWQNNAIYNPLHVANASVHCNNGVIPK